jgi:hypothetical protein
MLQGLGIVLARLVSDGRTILASGIVCASMLMTGWDRRACLAASPLAAGGVVLVNADSVQQPPEFRSL